MVNYRRASGKAEALAPFLLLSTLPQAKPGTFAESPFLRSAPGVSASQLLAGVMISASSRMKKNKPVHLYLTYYTSEGRISKQDAFALTPKRSHKIAIRPKGDDAYVDVQLQNQDRRVIRVKSFAITAEPVVALLLKKTPTQSLALHDTIPLPSSNVTVQPQQQEPPCENCTVLPEVVVTAPSISSISDSQWRSIIADMGYAYNTPYTIAPSTMGGGMGAYGNSSIEYNLFVGNNIIPHSIKLVIDNEKKVEPKPSECFGLLRMAELSFMNGTRESTAIMQANGTVHILPMQSNTSTASYFPAAGYWFTYPEGSQTKVGVRFHDPTGQLVEILDVVATYHTHPLCTSDATCGNVPSQQDRDFASSLPSQVTHYNINCCGITQYNGTLQHNQIIAWPRATNGNEFRESIIHNTSCTN